MERSDDLGNQSAGRAVVPGKEGVLLKEALAAIAAVTPFTQMQQRCPAKRNILDYLHPIVVYTVSECSTGRASVLDPWQLKVYMDFLGKIFNLCDDYIYQIEQLCSIIFVEHRDSSFS